MHASHLHDASAQGKPQGAREAAEHPEGYDRTRDTLALRVTRLEEWCPEALDLAALAYTRLRHTLHGEASTCSGQHAPTYWRAALRGEHAISIEDLSRLALEHREAFLASVLPLVEACGCAIHPVEGHPTRGLVLEAVDVSTAAAGLVREAAEAEADGNISVLEAERIQACAAQVEQEVADVRARASAAATACEVKARLQARKGGAA